MSRSAFTALAILLIATSLAAEARKIPGLTAKDEFPRGCVDCHTVLPDKRDMRFSTLARQWAKQVSPALLAKVQPVAPKGVTLKGKHPAITAAMLKDVPAGCAKTCHAATSKVAPALAPMMHAIHFSGGEKNDFIAKLGGECTHCHKYQATSGSWNVPSGAEK